MNEALYAEYPAAYDALYAHKEYERETAWVRDRFAELGNGGDRALVVGCGTGNHDPHLLDAGFEVTGVDPYRAMVERADAKHPGATHAVDELPDLSVDGEFDLVWAPFTVLNHLPRADLGAAVRSMADRLASGGLLVADTLEVDAEDGETPTRLRAHPDPDGDGHYARLVQSYAHEDHYRWDSLVRTPAGEWFVDSHDLWNHDPAFLAGVLAGAGLEPTVHESWYGEERPGHAVFEGWKPTDG